MPERQSNHPQKHIEMSIELSMETLLDDRQLDYLHKNAIVHIAVPYAFYDLDDRLLAARARALRERGMAVDTCHLPFGGGNGIHSACAENEKIRQATVNMWRYYLNRFPFTGVRATPMHTGGCMRRDMPAVLRNNLTEVILALLPLAREVRTILALENTFYDNPPPFSCVNTGRIGVNEYLNDDCDMLRDYVLAFGDETVRVCMDVGHSNLYGHNVLEDHRLLAPLVALYHIHDNDGIGDRHYAPGEGNLPFGALGRVMACTAQPSPLFIEVLNSPDPERQARIHEPETLIKTLSLAHAALDAQ